MTMSNTGNSEQTALSSYVADALASLSADQLLFIKQLPKAELHAHLNGCIPIALLQQLATQYTSAEAASSQSVLPDAVKAGVDRLTKGITLDQIHDFFGLFPAIYALTSSPEPLALATRAVLAQFLDPSPIDGYPQAAYLELRSTPRESPAMTRLKYVQTVLDEVEKYPPHQAALIVSLDRRMSDAVASECIDCAVSLRKAGRRVVGIDLCGDPLAGNMQEFEKHFKVAKEAGLGITLHIAETRDNPLSETLQLLSYAPNRLGHATFLGDAEKDFVHGSKICVEICLSSNLLCKTVQNLNDHHIAHYLKHNHPIAICTDDTLPFRNTLVGEYALLMAKPPLGLGLSEEEVERIAKMGMECRFKST